MKNLLFVAAFVAAMSFASCGGQATSAAPTNDSDSVAADTAAVMDTVVVDTIVAE